MAGVGDLTAVGGGDLALLYAAEPEEAEILVRFLIEQEPGLEVRFLPNSAPDSEVEFAIVSGDLQVDLHRFPNLRAVQSTWAGVNALLSSPRMPFGVPLARMVAPEMTAWMSEYVVFHVLDVTRKGSEVRAAQKQRRWGHANMPARNSHVGILGLGELGGAIARLLVGLGFEVSGWSRAKKSLAGIVCHAGQEGLAMFLKECQILVCLLPLTKETAGILDARLFAGLPRGSTLIHAGRGAHLVELDLLRAVDEGRLAHAILDVFGQEPLPAGHPFWSHPGITVTPHVAAISKPGMGAPLILENYRRAMSGRGLIHQVDRARGY